MEKLKLDDVEWRKRLDKKQYEILRRKGTERAFTGKYHDYKGKGVFLCAGCGEPLFSAETKFDSGTGWPSFYAPIVDEAVGEKEDRSLFSRRTEVVCGKCDGHLGHVFDDGPDPTGLRYCINSGSLELADD